MLPSTGRATVHRDLYHTPNGPYALSPRGGPLEKFGLQPLQTTPHRKGTLENFIWQGAAEPIPARTREGGHPPPPPPHTHLVTQHPNIWEKGGRWATSPNPQYKALC